MIGLDGRVRARLAELAKALARRNMGSAWANWLGASMEAPAHPEILRWSAVLHQAEGRGAQAVEALQRAIVACPDDPELLRMLGVALLGQHEHAAGVQMLRRAAAHTIHAADWIELGIAFDRQGYDDDALAAADHALARQPQDTQARLLRARCLQASGRAAAAAIEYRHLIRRDADCARAWFALLDLKTEAVEPAETAALERAERRATGIEERILLGFALGRAHEVAGQHDRAFEVLERANRAAASQRPWNAAAFSAQVDAIGTAFGDVQNHGDADQGAQVLFVVGLPRSGSTLVEQVLAAHPQVEGASELPYLQQVLAGESARRRRPLAEWARQASASDWTRLGQEYLSMTARWRERRPLATDKMPSNWLLAGAAMAMLPQARIIDCRRDPLETCWSCYRQLFAPGMADYSHDFAHLASYWKDQQRLARLWQQRASARYREFRYEDLVADPEPFARELLAFCGLPFDPRCLRPHEAQRGIRTASSAQVREPIRKRPGCADRYGERLAPLRRLLEPD